MSTVSSASSGAPPLTASAGPIDVHSIVSALMQVQNLPMNRLTSEVSADQSQISAFGQIQSSLSSLQTAAQGLSDLTLWKSATGTSTDSSSVAVTTSTGAQSGSFSVNVSQLAAPQTAVSDDFSSSSAVVGGGTLQIQMGTYSGSPASFTADSTRAAASITIAPGSTLSQIQSAINGAAAGVQASLVNDGGQVRLMLTATSSGTANAFKITTQDSDGNNTDNSGISALTVDPSGAGNVAITQQATDAKYSIGGVNLTSSSNHVANALDGVSLDLLKTTSSPVGIQIASDKTGITNAVNTFISAYNKTLGLIQNLTSYNAATKTAGQLQGNFQAVAMLGQLQNLVSQTVGTGSLSSLSAAGVQVQKDGTLSLNSTTFSNALSDPTQLKTLFANLDSNTPGNVGIAQRFDTLVSNVLGTNGLINGAVSMLNSQVSDLQQRESALSEQLSATQARLTQMYSTLDGNLQKMSGNTSFLSQLMSTTSTTTG
jgi:flagellar hook-associated protein 2